VTPIYIMFVLIVCVKTWQTDKTHRMSAIHFFLFKTLFIKTGTRYYPFQSCCILTISYGNSSFFGITNNIMLLDLNSYFPIAIGLDFKFYFVSKQNKRRIATKQERQTSTNWSPRQNMEVKECIYS